MEKITNKNYQILIHQKENQKENQKVYLLKEMK